LSVIPGGGVQPLPVRHGGSRSRHASQVRADPCREDHRRRVSSAWFPAHSRCTAQAGYVIPAVSPSSRTTLRRAGATKRRALVRVCRHLGKPGTQGRLVARGQ
jgi:hypothetical protein